MEVAIISAVFSHYHLARLKACQRWTDGSVVGVEVVGGKGATGIGNWRATQRREGVGISTVFCHRDYRQLRGKDILRAVGRVLSRLRPTVVIVAGWSDSSALAGLYWSQRNRVPAVMLSETTEGDESRVFWKEAFKGRIVRMCAAALVGGSPHAAYLRKLGVASRNIFTGYDVVDNDYFGTNVADIRKRQAESRNKYGLPEKYFLASARFVEKKNLPRLLRAYARYRTLCGDQSSHTIGLKDPGDVRLSSRPVIPWSLVLLGDGPLGEPLCALRSALGLDTCVHMPGFRQYPDLPAYYGLANAFIHASTTDQWGLVVNEAMASGLPVLVSNHCGCAPDLVQEGVNGFTFDPHDVEQLAGLMVKLSSGQLVLDDMGSASRRIIAEWGPERFASGLKAAVAKALEVGPKAAMLLDRLLLRALSVR